MGDSRGGRIRRHHPAPRCLNGGSATEKMARLTREDGEVCRALDWMMLDSGWPEGRQENPTIMQVRAGRDGPTASALS